MILKIIIDKMHEVDPDWLQTIQDLQANPTSKHLRKAVARGSQNKIATECIHLWPYNKEVRYQSPWLCNTKRNETNVFWCYWFYPEEG